MPELKLVVSAETSNLLVGEVLTISISLQNISTEAVNVGSPDALNPFEFVLRSDDPERGPMVLSEQQALLEQIGDPVPLEEEVQTLPAGQKFDYQTDLTGLARGGISAGRYELHAMYLLGEDAFRSDPISLVITAPSISSVAATYDRTMGSNTVVFAHDPGGVFQRQSLPGSLEDGVAYRRSSAVASSVATAAETAEQVYESGNTKWFWWLDEAGAGLGGGIAQQQTLFVSMDPQPLTLKSVSLSPHGWQDDVNHGVAAVLGLQDGRPTLDLITFAAVDKATTHQSAPLQLTGLPGQWAVQRNPGGKASLVTVVTQQDGSTVVQVHAISSAGAIAPVTLWSGPAPVAAKYLDPLPPENPEEAPAIDLLVGPMGDDLTMKYMRLPLDGGAAIREFSFRVARDTVGQPPRDWVLGPVDLEVPVVLARFGEQLIGRELIKGAQSFVLLEDSVNCTHVSLTLVEDELWALWHKIGVGMVYRQIPVDAQVQRLVSDQQDDELEDI